MAAVPVVMAIAGAGASAASTYSQNKKAKKAYENAKKNQYMFSDEQRQSMLQQLIPLILGSGHGVGGGAGMPGAAQQMYHPAVQRSVNDWAQSVLGKFSQPTSSYQAYLQSLQERRDARTGVPNVPPQGAASPSAQRSTVPGGGARSY